MVEYRSGAWGSPAVTMATGRNLEVHSTDSSLLAATRPACLDYREDAWC